MTAAPPSRVRWALRRVLRGLGVAALALVVLVWTYREDEAPVVA